MEIPRRVGLFLEREREDGCAIDAPWSVLVEAGSASDEEHARRSTPADDV